MIMKHVLLIEDDADDQEFFANALKQYQNINLLGISKNGKEAINLLKSAATLPDIIFLDYNMPVMNGIECLNEIKNNLRTECIPVFMLSESMEKAEVACKLGAEKFIQKSDSISLKAVLNHIAKVV